MASGRFVTNTICADKKINQLSCDTSRLAFTWLITFADCEGRTYGDPAVVRSMLFPRRQDISIEQMEAFITEWAAKEMIVWYEAEGDLWIWFPNFEKHQTGLRKDHEAASKIPPYFPKPQNDEGITTEELRNKDVPVTAQIKLSQVKLSDDSVFSPISAEFSRVTGITPFKLDKWTEAEQDMNRAGVTAEDIALAVNKLKGGDKPMSVTGLWSITGTAISIHADRLAGRPFGGKKSRSRLPIEGL